MPRIKVNLKKKAEQVEEKSPKEDDDDDSLSSDSDSESLSDSSDDELQSPDTSPPPSDAPTPSAATNKLNLPPVIISPPPKSPEDVVEYDPTSPGTENDEYSPMEPAYFPNSSDEASPKNIDKSVDILLAQASPLRCPTPPPTQAPPSPPYCPVSPVHNDQDFQTLESGFVDRPHYSTRPPSPPFVEKRKYQHEAEFTKSAKKSRHHHHTRRQDSREDMEADRQRRRARELGMDRRSVQVFRYQAISHVEGQRLISVAEIDKHASYCKTCGDTTHIDRQCHAFKTSRCVMQDQNGRCPFPNCPMAHGNEILRTPGRNTCIKIKIERAEHRQFILRFGCGSQTHSFYQCRLNVCLSCGANGHLSQDCNGGF